MTVAGLLARCDLHREPTSLPREVEPRPWRPGWSPYLTVGEPLNDGSASFDVGEFAVLDDGGRVLLHDERGFTIRGGSRGDPWSGLTQDSVRRCVLTTVLPDDDDTEDAHPYEWLANLCQLRGLHVTPEQLRRVPYVVELSEQVLQRLAHRSPSDE